MIKKQQTAKGFPPPTVSYVWHHANNLPKRKIMLFFFFLFKLAANTGC